MAAETIVSAIVRGTPSAVPLSPPKLDLMSLRTTPVWPSTSGPLEPLAGNGPAVSCGILVWQPPTPTVGVGRASVSAPEEWERARSKSERRGGAEKLSAVHCRASREQVPVQSAEVIVIVVRVSGLHGPPCQS